MDAMPNEARSLEEETGRRRHPRTSVLWSGNLQYLGGATDCVILNLSAKGARLRIKDRIAFGSPLVLAGRQIGEMRGRIAWRKGEALGLEFLDGSLESAPGVADVLRK